MITFGVDALLFEKTATITVTVDPQVPSTLQPGTFTAATYEERIVPLSGSGRTLVPEHREAVVPSSPGLWAMYDCDGDHVTGRFAQGAKDGLYPRQVRDGSLRRGAGYFGSDQNVVVLARMSTFTTVDTPQFVALHLEVAAGRGVPFTQESIVSANLFAGDLLARQPAAGGGTFPGRVLADTGPIQVRIVRGALPEPSGIGSIEGSAEGDLFTTDDAGQVFGAHVAFAFHAWITCDDDPILPNRRFNRTDLTPSLPGP